MGNSSRVSVSVEGQEGWADSSFQQNTRREKQLAGGTRRKSLALLNFHLLWPQDYVNHGKWIHSSLSKENVGLFNWIWIKTKFFKCYPSHADVWATDALWLQMLTTCSSLRKPWETKGTDRNVCTQSPSYGALPPFLWSWTKSLFIHSTGIMRDRNNFLSPTGSSQIVTLTGFLTIWSGQQLVCG